MADLSPVLVVYLFPALPLGGEVKIDDLVQRNGLFSKKCTDVPSSYVIGWISPSSIYTSSRRVN